MGVGGKRRVIDARGHLDAEGSDVITQCQHSAEGRGPLLGVGNAVPVRPACGVGEDGIDPAGRQVDFERVGAQDFNLGEDHEVDRCQRRGCLVALDGEYSEPETRQRHRVPADAAAQVGHVLHAGVLVACGMVS